MSKYELIGLVLNDGEKSRIKELCLKYGIPITFPTLFDDNINYHLWAFNKGGIGLAGSTQEQWKYTYWELS